MSILTTPLTKKVNQMASLGRSSALIAAGTFASRITGLLRTIVLVTLIGSLNTRAGDAFANANQLPNNIYIVISTGILTAVIVPQIVRVSQRDADGGAAFISKLFTLATVVLLGATALAMLAAPGLIWLYAPKFTPEQLALATAFAYWCLPQILFYGLYALVGETLNARGIFGPFAWAPVVNNVVSIAGFGAMIVMFGSGLTAVDLWTPGMIAGIGGTATAGIVVQALVLVLFWRKTGLLHPARLPLARSGAAQHRQARRLDVPDDARDPGRRAAPVTGGLRCLRRRRCGDLRDAERVADLHGAVLNGRDRDPHPLLHADVQPRRSGTRR